MERWIWRLESFLYRTLVSGDEQHNALSATLLLLLPAACPVCIPVGSQAPCIACFVATHHI
jgi:hypothetical protein